jgi:hypothetical protein
MLCGPCRLFLLLMLGVLGILGSAGRAAAADIDVKLVHFGTGDIARGGDTLAIQLEFRSALDRVIEIEAVLELENADRDIAEFSRTFVLNPGQAQRRWVYGALPPMGEGTLLGSVFDLRLYELRGGERVRDLGTAKLGPTVAENTPIILTPEVDALLVIGSRKLGLDMLEPLNQADVRPSMHQATRIALVKEADALPDRTEGFAPFRAIIWASGAIAPTRLSEETAQALTEWIRRGGTFVVALPAAGDPWSLGSPDANPLSGILPAVAPRRIEGVKVRDLIQMLSVRDDLRDPEATLRIAAFDPATLPRGWRPFIAVPARRNPDGTPVVAEGSPDGLVVGVRRSLGFGSVTVLGLDVDELASRSLQNPILPQVDVFWNRVIGLRADTPSGAELNALEAESRAVTGGYTRGVDIGRAVSGEIGLAGQAAVGVLAATAVFALYWLLAGPIGFAALKAMKRERWSWVGYVAIAAVFSVGILLIGGPLAGRSARIQHMTVLDMVEPAKGESDLDKIQHRRATSWFSLFSPGYGTVEVALDPKGDTGVRNQLKSWRAFSSDAEGFPSRERYRVPLDAPATLEVPSRATSIDFEGRWLGAVDPKWGLFPRATVPVEVTVDRSSSPATISIKGELVHSLPGALRDVQLLHVWPVRNPLPTLTADGKAMSRRQPGQMPNRGALVALQDWSPGQPLRLDALLEPKPISDRSLQAALSQRYYDTLYAAARNLGQGFGISTDTVDPQQATEILSFYSMLPPPPYIRNPPTDVKVLRVARNAGRELDLANWFTEPCIVVMGRLDNVPLPYPVLVDGEEVESTGSVHVRWVLPLPDDPSWIVPERIVRAGTDDAIKDGTGTREDDEPGEPGAGESGAAGSEG